MKTYTITLDNQGIIEHSGRLDEFEQRFTDFEKSLDALLKSEGFTTLNGSRIFNDGKTLQTIYGKDQPAALLISDIYFLNDSGNKRKIPVAVDLRLHELENSGSAGKLAENIHDNASTKYAGLLEVHYTPLETKRA